MAENIKKLKRDFRKLETNRSKSEKTEEELMII